MDRIKDLDNKMDDVLKAVQEIKDLIKQPPTDDNFVDSEVICNHFKISKDSLRRYRKLGIIPAYKINGKVYFLLSEVKSAIKEHYYGIERS